MSNLFKNITIVVLSIGLIALAFTVYEQAHVISLQRHLILDTYRYIVIGCPTNS